jgi:hypothetical protein
MEQERFEKYVLILILSAVLISVSEFVAIAFLIGDGGLVALHTAMMAGIGTINCSVILVFLAMLIFKGEMKVNYGG